MKESRKKMLIEIEIERKDKVRKVRNRIKLKEIEIRSVEKGWRIDRNLNLIEIEEIGEKFMSMEEIF